MRDYYLHARVVHRVSSQLILRCQETLSRRGTVQRRLRQEALADGLYVMDERIHLVHPDGRDLREDPTRLMKIYWHSHRLGFDLGVGAERAVEEALDLVDERFRRSPEVRDLFLDICRSWGRVAQTLRSMHHLGFLGRYLPEFGALTCLVQYDVYHKFTADQHSLIAVEGLEALAPGASTETQSLAQVLNEVEHPDLLMLGMLLHDIGKGKGHGHVAKGIPLAEELTARLGLADEAAGAVVFLVAKHVALSHVAQRRDVNDPKTVETLAEGRAHAADRAAGRGSRGHGALPSPRSRLLRPRDRHPRRAGALLAHRGQPRRPRHQHPLRADPHAGRRHRHRYLPGQ